MKHFHDLPFEFNKHEIYYGSIKPSYIQSDDGIKLAYYHIKSASTPKSIIVFIHGAGAHCYMSDYQDIGISNLDNTIDYYFIDLRGHGNSEGNRGSAPTKERVWKDISNIIAYIKKTNNNAPLILAGHSAGAGFVINYATWKKRIECDGYILISPYLGWRANSSRNSLLNDTFALPITRNFVINTLSLGLLCGNQISVYYNYPQEVLKMDPLLVSSITCNMSKSCTLWNPKKQFTMIKKPISLFIGSKDELFDPEKVLSYQKYLSDSIRKISHFEILPELKHLTILTSINSYLLHAVENIRLTTAST